MPPVQWDQLFVFTVSPFELFLRGTIVYLLIFTLMRVLRREPGTVGIADLLMVVLIADASQSAMASDYRSILDGGVLIFTIVGWNYALDWLSARSRTVERFTYPDPIPLIHEGRLDKKNLNRQFVTPDQLLSILREHGVDKVSKVKAAYLEGSGHVSVIPFEEGDSGASEPPERARRTGT
jgi:uncharacterized membrane protein YcaP (DUF421 family)